MSVYPSSVPTQEVYFPNAGFIYGMRLTYATTTTITVSQGFCRDSSSQDNIVLALPPNNDQSLNLQPFTLNSAVNGAGGLDTGTLAASTLYYVFAIASSDNSKINNSNSPQQSLPTPPFTSPAPSAQILQDGYYIQATVLMSTSLVPVLPFGYDMYRRIGAVRTDSMGHFLAFTQTGWGENRTMRYQVPIAPGSAATAGSATYATIGALLNIVPQVPLDVIISASYTPVSAADILYFAPYGNVALASGGYEAAFSGAAASVLQLETVTVPGEFNATPVIEVDYATTDGDGTVAFLVIGYIDPL